MTLKVEVDFSTLQEYELQQIQGIWPLEVVRTVIPQATDDVRWEVKFRLIGDSCCLQSIAWSSRASLPCRSCDHIKDFCTSDEEYSEQWFNADRGCLLDLGPVIQELVEASYPHFFECIQADCQWRLEYEKILQRQKNTQKNSSPFNSLLS